MTDVTTQPFTTNIERKDQIWDVSTVHFLVDVLYCTITNQLLQILRPALFH